MTIGAPFRPLPQSNIGNTSIEVQQGLGRTPSQESATYAQQFSTNNYRRVGSNTPPSLERYNSNKAVTETSPVKQQQQVNTPPPPPFSADVPISIENVCDDDPPLSRIFVRCSHGMSEEELQQLFSRYGEVQQLKLITIKATNKFKGKLFVKFAKASSAALAIENLHGKEIKGSALTVQLAESYRTSVERRAMMVDEADYPPFSRLFITCPTSLTYQELHKIFSEFGGVQHIVLLKDKYTQASRGMGFVKYSTTSAASLATANFAKPRKDQPYIMCRLAEPRSAHRSQKMGNAGAPMPEEAYFQSESDAHYGDGNSYFPHAAEQQDNEYGYNEPASGDSSEQSLIELLVQLATSESHQPVQATSVAPQVTNAETCDCEECLTSALLLLLTNETPKLAPANPTLNAALLRQLASLSENESQSLPDSAPARPHRASKKATTKISPHHAPAPTPLHLARVPHVVPKQYTTSYLSAALPSQFPMLPLNGLAPPGLPLAPPSSAAFPLVSPVETVGPFPPASRLFITFARQLPPEVLQSVFGQYGSLAYAYLLNDRNYGFVQYYTAASARLAIEALNNRGVLGVPCRVLVADPYTNNKSKRSPHAMPTQEDANEMIERIAEFLAAQGSPNPYQAAPYPNYY